MRLTKQARSAEEESDQPRDAGGTPITVTGVGLSIETARILDEVSLEFARGTLTALVGPNGAGKSTLFAVIAGDIEPTEGAATVAGRPVGEWGSRDLATRRAVLVQDHRVRFAFTVREVVEMGRQPHRSDPVTDDAIVAAAMETTDVPHLADREVTSLSGGEAARAAFARVLAQRCPVVLLDEPTAALDLRHQEMLLTTARELADAGACVVVVLHDLNLASGYADRIVMLRKGRIAADGTPAEVLTAEKVREVYGQEVIVLDHPTRGTPLIVTV